MSIPAPPLAVERCPVVYVRWVDAVEDEAETLAEDSHTCVREQVGWLVHNQANRFVICTEVVAWHDGSHTFSRTTIDPDWIIEMREVH